MVAGFLGAGGARVADLRPEFLHYVHAGIDSQGDAPGLEPGGDAPGAGGLPGREISPLPKAPEISPTAMV